MLRKILEENQGEPAPKTKNIKKERTAEKGDYRVTRPFKYHDVLYKKGDVIEATQNELKFLLRNNLIH